eukprot:200095-Prymnesium_polylepis.1
MLASETPSAVPAMSTGWVSIVFPKRVGLLQGGEGGGVEGGGAGEGGGAAARAELEVNNFRDGRLANRSLPPPVEM